MLEIFTPDTQEPVGVYSTSSPLADQNDATKPEDRRTPPSPVVYYLDQMEKASGKIQNTAPSTDCESTRPAKRAKLSGSDDASETLTESTGAQRAVQGATSPDATTISTHITSDKRPRDEFADSTETCKSTGSRHQAECLPEPSLPAALSVDSKPMGPPSNTQDSITFANTFEEPLEALFPLTEADDESVERTEPEADSGSDLSSSSDVPLSLLTRKPSVTLPISTPSSTSASPFRIRIRIPARRSLITALGSNALETESISEVNSNMPLATTSTTNIIQKRNRKRGPYKLVEVQEEACDIRCPEPRCSATYTHPAGPKYHRLHDKCPVRCISPSIEEEEIDMESLEEDPRLNLRYSCTNSECHKTFKDRNGLEHHLRKRSCISKAGFQISTANVLEEDAEQDTRSPAENFDAESYTDEVPKMRKPCLRALPTAAFVDEPLALIDGIPVYRFLDLQKLVAGLELFLKVEGILPRQPENVESKTGAQTLSSSFHGRPSTHRELRFAGEYSHICVPGAVYNKETRKYVLNHVVQSAMSQLSDICFGSILRFDETGDECHSHMIYEFSCNQSTTPMELPKASSTQSQNTEPKTPISGPVTPLPVYDSTTSSFLPCSVPECPHIFPVLPEKPPESANADSVPPISFASSSTLELSEGVTLNVAELVDLDFGGSLKFRLRSISQPNLGHLFPASSYPTPVSPKNQGSAIPQAATSRVAALRMAKSPAIKPKCLCGGRIQVRSTFDLSHPIHGIVGIKSVLMFEHSVFKPKPDPQQNIFIVPSQIPNLDIPARVPTTSSQIRPPNNRSFTAPSGLAMTREGRDTATMPSPPLRQAPPPLPQAPPPRPNRPFIILPSPHAHHPPPSGQPFTMPIPLHAHHPPRPNQLFTALTPPHLPHPSHPSRPSHSYTVPPPNNPYHPQQGNHSTAPSRAYTHTPTLLPYVQKAYSKQRSKSINPKAKPHPIPPPQYYDYDPSAPCPQDHRTSASSGPRPQKDDHPEAGNPPTRMYSHKPPMPAPRGISEPRPSTESVSAENSAAAVNPTPRAASEPNGSNVQRS